MQKQNKTTKNQKMKKIYLIGVLTLVIILSMSFISAGWLADALAKITGYAVANTNAIPGNNSADIIITEGPTECYYGESCGPFKVSAPTIASPFYFQFWMKNLDSSEAAVRQFITQDKKNDWVLINNTDSSYSFSFTISDTKIVKSRIWTRAWKSSTYTVWSPGGMGWEVEMKNKPIIIDTPATPTSTSTSDQTSVTNQTSTSTESTGSSSTASNNIKISDITPSGIINYGDVIIEFKTDKIANCRAVQEKDADTYDNMNPSIFSTSDGINHKSKMFNFTRFKTGIYNYALYVKCKDSAGNINQKSVIINLSFNIPSIIKVKDTKAPVISEGKPKGVLSNGEVTISVKTNEVATCRAYGKDLSYGEMNPNLFSTADGINHVSKVMDLTILGNNNYKLYVKCKDSAKNVNLKSYIINFSINIPEPEMQCYDSDEGKNYEVFGVAGDSKFPDGLEDYCYTDNKKTNELVEYYCKDNQIAMEIKKCDGLCSEGVCLAKA